MPRVLRSFVKEKLLPALDIVDLINRFVSLKRAGSNYVCCCPFHHEKTPSFTVTPSKQMFYCFGCKEHGNALDFLMKYKNEGFVEAVQEAASIANLEVEYEAGGYHRPEDEDLTAAYYELMDRSAAFFQAQLRAVPKALEYFTKRRQLSEETIVNARLGYAPDSWDALRQGVARNDHEYRLLIKLGLVLDKGAGRTFSMFRNRVMIPIRDKSGRIISFGGRTLGDDKPKYLNTAENPIFHKRRELFGLYEALQANRNRPPRLMVVEGYLDVIALRQFGINYAVASLGTATTGEQFRLMFRSTKQVICCYDGDAAGRIAAWHALETVTEVLQPDWEVRFAFLPPEHDPDSLVRAKGKAAVQQVIDAALSYPEFLLRHLKDQYDLGDPGQQSLFINAYLMKVKVIPVPALQLVALKLASELLGQDSSSLRQMMDSLTLSSFAKVNAAADRINPAQYQKPVLLRTPMRRLIAFILQQPTLVSSRFETFELDQFAALCKDLQVKGQAELAYLLRLIKEKPDLNSAWLLEDVRGTAREKYIRDLMDANLVPGIALADLSQADRVRLLHRCLTEVLLEPIQLKAGQLRTNPHMTRADLAEAAALSKIAAERSSQL